MRTFILSLASTVVPTVTANHFTMSPLHSLDNTCTLLEKKSVDTFRPNSTTYIAREADYYSASAVMGPGCIVMPKCTEQVSEIVKTLTRSTTTNWAVRSGGHMAWGPAADIHDGVTIDLGNLNQTVFDAETRVARIGGGALWRDVYSTLEPFGVTVAGGRTSTVGVGGFLLGGGNNFHSGKVGFGCDTVVNFEVVLSSGEIVNANNSNNADLFKALKGGAGNFGIVTRFDMETIDAGLFYGGFLTHTIDKTTEVINAFSNFVGNIVNYQEGSGFSFWGYVAGASESVIISVITDTTNAEDAPAYDEYKGIRPVLSSTVRHDSHLNMTVELEFAKGNRNVWFAISVKNDPKILEFIIEHHNEFIAKWHRTTGDDTMSMYTVFQPLPTILFDHGVEKGGNVLGMDREKENAVLFQVFMVFNGDVALEAEARRRLVDYRQTVKQESVSTGTDVEFAYMNYADKTQDPLATYGEENIAFMRQVAHKYDPLRLYQTRSPGGFKLP